MDALPKTSQYLGDRFYSAAFMSETPAEILNAAVLAMGKADEFLKSGDSAEVRSFAEYEWNRARRELVSAALAVCQEQKEKTNE